MSKPEEFYTEEDEITFNILNPETVRKLEREGNITLPKKKVDVPKDMRWNTKQMASKLYQGILGGDSIPKIAKSLMDVIGNNKASAVRNARTMVTGAENAGRLDSYNDLAEQGVVQKKEWIATPDDRTRESHIAVDGEERDINDPFSNGLMYPGDPAGDPAEVWNCRCSMGTHIVGFRKADGSVSKVDYTADRTMHEEQMEAEKERRGFEAPQKEKIDIPQLVQIDFDKFIDKYMESKFEYTMTCDENGNVMYQGGGKKTSVSTPLEIALDSEGCYTIHNHPEDVVFSPGDIKYIEQYGLKVSTVITSDGNEYTLLNLDPVRKKESDLLFYWEAVDAHDKFEQEITNDLREFRTKIMASDMSREEKTVAIQTWMRENNTNDKLIDWYEKNAEKYGFIFQKTKR